MLARTHKGMTIIIGHALRNEGAPQPFNDYPSSLAAPGRCQCGVYSDLLASNMQRKAWHREHKKHVKEALALLDPQDLERAASRHYSLERTGVYYDQNVYIKAPHRSAAMYELLAEKVPDHSAFEAGFKMEEGNDE